MRMTSLSAPGHIRLLLAVQDDGPEIPRAQSLKTTYVSPFKTKGTEGTMKVRTWNRRLAWATHKPFSQERITSVGGRSKRMQAALRVWKKQTQQQNQKINVSHTRALSRGPLLHPTRLGVMKSLMRSSDSVIISPIPQGGVGGGGVRNHFPLQNNHPTPCFQPSETST